MDHDIKIIDDQVSIDDVLEVEEYGDTVEVADHAIDDNIDNINDYTAGYIAACTMITDDQEYNDLLSMDEYLDMEGSDDAYARGWYDGVTEFFFESTRH